MYIVRDIFHLKFGMFRDAFASIQSASKQGLFISTEVNVLSDFTGDSYRLILETNYPSLAEYEHFLTQGMKDPKWQEFYQVFKTYIQSSHREIMKRHII